MRRQKPRHRKAVRSRWGGGLKASIVNAAEKGS